MDDCDPPAGPMPADAEARRGALRLMAGPAVFLVHFAAVYGFNAVACSFGWAARTQHWQGLALVPLVVLLLTALAVGLLLWSMPRPLPEPANDIENPYDPAGRAHFVAHTARRSDWLAIAGMLLVALMALLARTCG